MRRAQRSVHDEHAAARRESAALEQYLDPLLERLIGERRETIEERRNESRRGPGQCQGPYQPDQPDPPPPPGPATFHEGERGEQQRASEQRRQQQLLDQIDRIQPRRDPIETEAGFDPECSPQREGQTYEL